MLSLYMFQLDNNRDVEYGGHGSSNTRLKGLRKITKSCCGNYTPHWIRTESFLNVDLRVL
jgi:hypothetical protein